jgi:hypothetical protein
MRRVPGGFEAAEGWRRTNGCDLPLVVLPFRAAVPSRSTAPGHWAHTCSRKPSNGCTPCQPAAQPRAYARRLGPRSFVAAPSVDPCGPNRDSQVLRRPCAESARLHDGRAGLSAVRRAPHEHSARASIVQHCLTKSSVTHLSPDQRGRFHVRRLTPRCSTPRPLTLHIQLPALEPGVAPSSCDAGEHGIRGAMPACGSTRFQGIEPTGREVAATGIGIARIANGKIVEAWAAYDAQGLLQQLQAASSRS